MPPDSDDFDGRSDDRTASDDATDDRPPEERAAAAADAIETVGADRLAELITDAWVESGLPPFDGVDADESDSRTDRTRPNDEADSDA